MVDTLTTTVELPADVGKRSFEDDLKFVRRQIPYKNFAGKNEDLDQIAVTMVRGHCNFYRARMAGVMRRWALNWRVANGDVPWLDTMDGVHMFEGKKALGMKTASIEEGILQFDPPLEIESETSEVDHREAKILQAWTHRKLENAGWQSLIQPVARAGELTNLLVTKVSYEKQRGMTVDRKIEFKPEGSEPKWEDTRTIKGDQITKRGCRVDQVDSFWFFYDIEAKDIQEARFVGDESEPFLHELLQQAESGTYSKSQLEKVVKARRTATSDASKSGVTTTNGSMSTDDRDNGGNSGWVDAHRHARSVALGAEFTDNGVGSNPNDAVRVRLIEDYCLFDFGTGFDGGIEDPLRNRLTGVHKVLISVVDGICIRFMLNPNDRKIVPYAVSKIEDNGVSAVAPAVFDAVTQVNAHYDQFATDFTRWVKLLANPCYWTPDTNNPVPQSMTTAKAGSVWRGVSKLEALHQPDLTPALMAWQKMYRNEVEELSGSLRVFEHQSGTATETERKVQAQQKQIRPSIRANCSMWAQVALIIKAMESQYSSATETFAVVGKSSQVVNAYMTITPDTMLKDVKFRFLGMNDLHVLGTRAQGLEKWMTLHGPSLPTLPQVDRYALAREHFELLVGRNAVDRIFPMQDAPWNAMSQNEENAALLAGHFVEVSEIDDDMQHMDDLLPFLARKDLPEYVMRQFVEHYNEHRVAAARKEAEQKAARQRAEQDGELMAPGGGRPGTDRPPAPGGMPADRPKGVTPGSDQSRTNAKGGRAQPTNSMAMLR